MPTLPSPGHGPESKLLLEAQLQATLNMIPAGTWYALPSGALTFLNGRCADYLGLPKNHPLRFGMDTGAGWDSHIPFLHPNDHEEMRRIWSACLSTGRAGEASFRVPNAEGGYRWFLCRAEPLRASDGTLLYWIGVNLEIDECKQAEFYLAEGERLGHMGSWVLDPAGFFPYWSHELFHIYGLRPAKKGPSLEEYLAIVHPQDREFMRSLVNRVFAEASECDVTKRIVRPDGEVRYVRCVAAPIVESGVLKRIVGTAIDVTEHEQLAQELQRRQAYLAEAQRLSQTGSFGWTVSSGEIRWSDETFRIFQCDPRTNPTVEFVLSRVHPDDRGLVQQQIDRASRDGKGFDLEHRLQLPDGSIKHVRVTARPSRDSLGNLEFLGAVTDVSEQRQAEAGIREREREVRQIVDLAPQLVSVFGPASERLYANRIALDYFGIGLDEWRQRSTGTHIHPDDSERVTACWVRALGSGTGYEEELRLRKHDGSYRWFLARYNPVRDDKGQIMRWYVAGTDIEDRKQAEVRLRHENGALKRAEERIREQEAELRQMLDLTPQHVHVLTADARLVYTNEIALKYHGPVLHDWQLRPLIDWRIDELPVALFHPEDRERVMYELQSTLSRGSQHELEARLLRNDGKSLWFLFRYNPLRDEQGRVVRWYVAGTDIEDRKQAEELLKHENVVLREEIDKASMFEEIVGTSPPLQAVLSRVSKVARTESTVLITGETGTGKELVARAIHRRSRRSSRAFVSVNCAAVPRDLIASELFGHEKGAFTGAAQRRLGRFELAGGGTIFLDEVGELPGETQIALLRVLQEHEFERVGGSRSIQTDVRVIAATNRDLQAAIAAGSFRSDLFYRLNVFPIEIPPLRERREDIPMLVEYFIDRFARKAGKGIRGLDKKTLDLLQSYAWPGNIRELQNVIERSVIVCESGNLSVDESWLSPQPLALEPTGPLYLSQKLATQEKEMIEAALRESEGRVFGPSGAAVKLGMPRSTLESKIRSLKINKHRFKTPGSSKSN